jgi:cell division protease FtsH
MVVRYGMSANLGSRTFGEHEELVFLGGRTGEEKDYSEKTAEQIDAEIKAIMAEAEKKAFDTLTNNKKTLEKMVAALMEKETLEQAEIEAVMGVPQGKDPSLPGIEIVE